MAYVPTNWVDRIVDQDNKVIARGTPLSALNFNHLETGVAEAHESIQEVRTTKASISSLETVANRVTMTESQIDAASEKIADLEDGVKEIGTDLEKHSVKISALQTTTGTHASDISALTTSISDLKGGAPAETTLKSLSDSISAITSGSGSGVSLQSLKTEIDEANEDLDQLETALTQAKNEHTADINSIKGGADTTTTLQSLKTQISTVSGEVSTLASEVSTAKTNHTTDITAVNSSITSLKGGAASNVTLNSLNVAISEIKGGANSSTTLQSLSIQVGNLSSEVSTLTSDLSGAKSQHNTDVTAINSAIASIKDGAASTVTLKSLKTQADGLSQSVSTLQSGLSETKTTVSGQVTSITALQTATSTNASAISAIKGGAADTVTLKSLKDTLDGQTSYLIKFQNSNGTLLDAVFAQSGSTPTYGLSTPVSPDSPNYVFNGWSPSITTATGAKTYKATYSGYPTAWTEAQIISDDWDKISGRCRDGSYKTSYSLGDTKIVDVSDEGLVMAQIVGFDVDELSDGTGKAKISWLCQHSLKNTRVWNVINTNAEGYPACYLKSVLENEIFPKLPQKLRNTIVSVKKTCKPASGSDLTTNCKLWVPSMRELGGLGLSTSNYETSGPTYTDPPTSPRGTGATPTSGSTGYCWTRTAYASSSSSVRIFISGSCNSGNASGAFRVALGFCTS